MSHAPQEPQVSHSQNKTHRGAKYFGVFVVSVTQLELLFTGPKTVQKHTAGFPMNKPKIQTSIRFRNMKKPKIQTSIGVLPESGDMGSALVSIVFGRKLEGVDTFPRRKF